MWLLSDWLTESSGTRGGTGVGSSWQDTDSKQKRVSGTAILSLPLRLPALICRRYMVSSSFSNLRTPYSTRTVVDVVTQPRSHTDAFFFPLCSSWQ